MGRKASLCWGCKKLEARKDIKFDIEEGNLVITKHLVEKRNVREAKELLAGLQNDIVDLVKEESDLRFRIESKALEVEATACNQKLMAFREMEKKLIEFID